MMDMCGWVVVGGLVGGGWRLAGVGGRVTSQVIGVRGIFYEFWVRFYFVIDSLRVSLGKQSFS